MSKVNLPLADDVLSIIAAFRENGSKSFDKYDSLDEVREIYRSNCIAAGMEPVADIEVKDFSCSGADGNTIALREYRKKDLEADILPAVIFTHGGGWVIGDLDSHDALCRYFSSISDHSVIAIDYRLVPENTFQQVLSDCKCGIQYIVDKAEELKIDTSSLSLMGDSAGAYLSAYFSQQFQTFFNKRIKSQILFYPVVNLNEKFPSYQEIDQGYPLTGQTMRWFLDQCHLSQLTQPLDSYSLINLFNQSRDSDNKPKVFLVTVGHDPLRDEGLYLSEQLAQLGFPLDHHYLPGHMHGIFTMFGVIPTAQNILKKAALFLKSN